jgi:hypothetical protein
MIDHKSDSKEIADAYLRSFFEKSNDERRKRRPLDVVNKVFEVLGNNIKIIKIIATDQELFLTSDGYLTYQKPAEIQDHEIYEFQFDGKIVHDDMRFSLN